MKFPYWGHRSLDWPVNCTVIWHFLLGACELKLLCAREKTAQLMLKIHSAPIPNFVAWASCCLEFVHPCYEYPSLQRVFPYVQHIFVFFHSNVFCNVVFWKSAKIYNSQTGERELVQQADSCMLHAQFSHSSILQRIWYVIKTVS